MFRCIDMQIKLICISAGSVATFAIAHPLDLYLSAIGSPTCFIEAPMEMLGLCVNPEPTTSTLTVAFSSPNSMISWRRLALGTREGKEDRTALLPLPYLTLDLALLTLWPLPVCGRSGRFSRGVYAVVWGLCRSVQRWARLAFFLHSYATICRFGAGHCRPTPLFRLFFPFFWLVDFGLFPSRLPGSLSLSLPPSSILFSKIAVKVRLLCCST